MFPSKFPSLKAYIHSMHQILACIGEQFPEGDEICGVAVNIRAKGDRIELWTKTSSNEAVQVRGRHIGPESALENKRTTWPDASLF